MNSLVSRRKYGWRSTLAGVVALAGLYGFWIPFLPLPWFDTTAAWVVFLVPGLLATMAFVRRDARKAPQTLSRLIGLVLAGLLLSPLLALLLWILVAKSAASVVTALIGQPVAPVIEGRFVAHSGRWHCDRHFQPSGQSRRFRLCIDPAMYRRHPEADVRVELVGLVSPLGLLVSEIRNPEATTPVSPAEATNP